MGTLGESLPLGAVYVLSKRLSFRGLQVLAFWALCIHGFMIQNQAWSFVLGQG